MKEFICIFGVVLLSLMCRYTVHNYLHTVIFLFRVVVFSSIPSSCVPVSIDIKLLEDKPGPVENLRLIPSNTSIAIAWSPPSLRNGMISGYAIYLEDTVVCCGDYYSITYT